MIYLFYDDTPLGKIGIAESHGKICAVTFAGEKTPQGATIKQTPLLRQAAHQLAEYFAGKRTVFDLPLEPLYGTPFQKRVWQALQEIPYGETRTYAQIAAMVHNPKGCRAVGMANHKNPLGIVVPCHRVIGANGSLTGYAGGLDKKQYLLDLENRIKNM